MIAAVEASGVHVTASTDGRKWSAVLRELRIVWRELQWVGTHFLAKDLTVDHIIARSKGGTDHMDNLQLLCGHCNSLKGDRPMEYLRARLVRAVRREGLRLHAFEL